MEIVRKIQISWDQIPEDSYVRDIESLHDLHTLKFESPVTFFTGENGSGKSTLLEAIAVSLGFNAEGGTRNYSFSTRETHSDLCLGLSAIRSTKRMRWGYFLRAESFYNVATMEEEYTTMGGIPQHLHLRSHGESFLEVMRNNLYPDSLYILDEPEAALSPQRALTLLCMMDEAVKQGSQFIAVSHSPILLAYPSAQILSFDGSLHPVSYEDTDSYRLTKLFITQRERILEQLLGEEQ